MQNSYTNIFKYLIFIEAKHAAELTTAIIIRNYSDQVNTNE
ncbi:MAG: hypothetical protein JWP81_1582 [Ferruginibacter sp.]|nr:hypothetical protein [Ferruginibacter sp.]